MYCLGLYGSAIFPVNFFSFSEGHLSGQSDVTGGSQAVVLIHASKKKINMFFECFFSINFVKADFGYFFLHF